LSNIYFYHKISHIIKKIDFITSMPLSPPSPRNHIIKDFPMNDERLKNCRDFGKDYFFEFLEHVCSIRASDEYRIYQQIIDIFIEYCIGYDPKSETNRNFSAHIQCSEILLPSRKANNFFSLAI